MYIASIDQITTSKSTPPPKRQNPPRMKKKTQKKKTAQLIVSNNVPCLPSRYKIQALYRKPPRPRGMGQNNRTVKVLWYKNHNDTSLFFHPIYTFFPYPFPVSRATHASLLCRTTAGVFDKVCCCTPPSKRFRVFFMRKKRKKKNTCRHFSTQHTPHDYKLVYHVEGDNIGARVHLNRNAWFPPPPPTGKKAIRGPLSRTAYLPC